MYGNNNTLINYICTAILKLDHLLYLNVLNL